MQKLFENEEDCPDINVCAKDYNDAQTVLVTTIKNKSLSTEERIAIVRWLLSKGADVTAEDEFPTPLMFTTAREDLEIAGLLLEAGSDVNAKDEDRFSTLDHAILENNFELAKLILEKNYSFGENTNPIVTAVDSFIDGNLTKKETENFVRLFRDKGADINAPAGEEGHTPLMWAVEAASVEMVELLLALGANPLKENLHEETPLTLATSDGGDFTKPEQRQKNVFPLIVEILKTHIEKTSQEPPRKRAKTDIDEISSNSLNAPRSPGIFQAPRSPQSEEEDALAELST